MKKSWTPILLCLGFILAWQSFVVGPYKAKETKAKIATEKATAATAVQSSTAGGTQASTGGALAVKGAALSNEERAEAVTVPVNGERSFKVFPDLSIGSAAFHEYVVRGSTEKLPVTLLSDGLRWSSTDPDVQACLNGLKQGPLNVSALSREFQTKTGSCKAKIAFDSNKPGLVHLELSLQGFVGSKGFLEFKGTDGFGSGPEQDHNYLGYRADDSRVWVRSKSLLTATHKEGKVDWVAWGDKYFITAFLPKGTYNPNIVYGPTSAEKDAKIIFGVQYPIFSKADSAAKYELSTYFGARDSEQLRTIDTRLMDAVDLGFFGAIARILIFSLKSLNKVLNNFGLSIIALTLLARILFWPLNKKVFVSGLRMKALQPQIERIRAKYANDKSKTDQMNRDLMGLYKTNKVNPVGSCAPMLLQLPIFIGLYAALGHSLDLYQAPFFGWIQDLSSRDPYFVLPVLWTISMLAYMKLNPQTAQQPGQPDMRWMMVGMNVFFGFLSKDWPSGLNLYLFVSNLVGIIQQVMLRRDPKLQPIQEGA